MGEDVGSSNREDRCYAASHSWFLASGMDVTLFRGVSLGRVVQVWVFERLFELSQVNADGVDLRSILKRCHLEWSVRAIWGWLKKSAKDSSRVDYLLIYDVNNSPMIGALNKIGLFLERQGECVEAVAVDPVILSKCAIGKKISWFNDFRLKDLFRAAGEFHRFWRGLRVMLTQQQSLLTNEFGARKALSISRYMRFQSLQLCAEILALEAVLKNRKPKVVILASDAHRVARQVVMLCKEMGIKTVVYQHGATVWKYGYVPVLADLMMVWGAAPRQWFVSQGVPEDKLFSVGNLSVDESVFPALARADFSSARKVFFLPNPIDREITRQMTSVFLDLCERFSMEGVVKLHPSEKNTAFFESLVSGSSAAIDISRAPISSAGICPGDIAIVVNSTAGIDCCVFGAFVLNMTVELMPNPVDYEGAGVGLRAGMANYREKFAELLDFPVDEYILKRAGFLRDHLGPMDGQALYRVQEAISKLGGDAHE